MCLVDSVRRQLTVVAAVSNGAGAAAETATATTLCPCLLEGVVCVGSEAECDADGDNTYW